MLRLDLSMPNLGSSAAGIRAPAPAQEVANTVMTEKEMRELQKSNLVAVLNQTNWRVSGKGGAAELLGIRPTTLADRIKTFKLKKPNR
jgi:transcriptional regulator with GAF, ATPase, and Fis domain